MSNKYFNIVEGEKPHASLWDYNNQDFIGNGGCHFDSDMNVEAGVDIPAGVLLDVDFENRKAYVVKCAKILDGGTTTIPHVDKNHLFKVNDTVYVSGAAVTISSIDKSNASYDAVTLSAPCDGAVSGKFLISG